MNAELPQVLVSFVALSLAVAALSMTITKAKVTIPLRNAIIRRSAWFGELFSCPYCMNHWLAVSIVAVYRPVIVDSGFYLLDLAVSALVVVALASFGVGLIYKSVSSIATIVPPPAKATHVKPARQPTS